MKILLLTDSLALPRERPEVVKFEETWPQLLKVKEHIVQQVSIGGATSEDILKQSKYYKFFMPDLVIVQVGIVDCAPRHVTDMEMKILKRVPIFGQSVLKVLNRPIIRKIRKLKYVSESVFKTNFKQIAQYFEQSKVLYVGIIPALEGYEQLLPGVKKSITIYNEIIKQVAGNNFVDLSHFSQDQIMSDYHHINKEGHSSLAIILDREINSFNLW